MSQSAAPSPESEVAPPTGPRAWRAWWTALLLGMPLLAAAALLVDQPLHGWADLRPPAIPPLSAGEKNGRVFLQEKWASYEDAPGFYVPGKLHHLRDSALPWNESDSEMVAAAVGGADRLEELRGALSLSGWRAADLSRVSEEDEDRIHTNDVILDFSALIMRQIQAHRMADAADTMLVLVTACRREAACAPLPGGLIRALRFADPVLAAIPPFLKEASGEEEGLCVKLQEACGTDWISADQLRACFLRDVESRTHDLLTLPREERVPEKAWPESRSYRIGQGFRSFFLKSRTTVNLFHTALRAAAPKFLLPVPDRMGSLEGIVNAFSDENTYTGYLLPNSEGRNYVVDELQRWQFIDQWCRVILFSQRAMTVRIALHRWQLNGRGLPALLSELTPEFLTSVPADPWDGHPLRWSVTGGGLLYGLGCEWTDNHHIAFMAPNDSPGYLSQQFESPALRLNLP